MADLKVTDVNKAARLLKTLAKKADYDGDGRLSGLDVNRSVREKRRGTNRRDSAVDALTAAVNRARARSLFQVEDVQAQIEDVRKKLGSLDLDDNGKLTEAELKKIKPDGRALAKALLEFAKRHAGDTVSDFTIEKGSSDTWKPSRPFRAPANATPAELATALVKHFDAFSNDNRWPGSISRYVLATTEAKGIVAELEKLPAATAKRVLRALSDQIHSTAVPLPYLVPEAVKVVKAFAAKLGVDYDFVGKAAAPKIGGW